LFHDFDFFLLSTAVKIFFARFQSKYAEKQVILILHFRFISLLLRYWRLLNEAWVLLHGTIVAIQTGDPDNAGKSAWPIFAFGFGFIFAFTQVSRIRSVEFTAYLV